MNPHKSFRASMAWLHTWSGLLLGWVLFAIFITGSAAYFRPEITSWMQPETSLVAAPSDAARHAFDRLRSVAPDAERWLIGLPHTRDRELTIHWKDPKKPGGAFQKESLDASAGSGPAPRATLGGEFLYRFHFQLMLPYPWGRYLACLAALFLLVALISGVVTHRRFFKDLFLLRLGRDGRRPWLDFHNVAAVVALPFYVLIGYSALVIFSPMLLPLATRWLAPAKPVPAATAASSPPPSAATSSTNDSAAPALWITADKFDLMLAHADRVWGAERPPRRIDITGRGTASPVVSIARAEADTITSPAVHRETLRFSGLTGLPLDAPVTAPSLGARIRGVFYGLHLARFAGPLLRTLCFAMGLLGAAMIGTGLVLWTLKRAERLPASGRGARFGHALVSRLNIATLAGLPLACAAFFWANRLIPAALPGRADLEPVCFLAVWGLALLHACLRPARTAWKEQFIATAFAFGALPVVDLLTAGRELDTWPRADALYAGFTFAMLALGTGFAFGALRLARRSATTVNPSVSPPPDSPATAPSTPKPAS